LLEKLVDPLEQKQSDETKKNLAFNSILFVNNMDQGKSIVSLYCAGMSVPDINMKLGVPKSTIYYQIKKFEKTGSTDKVPGQGRK